jgi:hypothetical protein
MTINRSEARDSQQQIRECRTEKAAGVESGGLGKVRGLVYALIE